MLLTRTRYIERYIEFVTREHRERKNERKIKHLILREEYLNVKVISLPSPVTSIYREEEVNKLESESRGTISSVRNV